LRQATFLPLYRVTVFDVGDEGGQPYIVSQHMAGGDLEGLLQTAGILLC